VNKKDYQKFSLPAYTLMLFQPHTPGPYLAYFKTSHYAPNTCVVYEAPSVSVSCLSTG